MDPQTSWHTLKVDTCLQQLNTSRNGLSQRDADTRLLQSGFNQLPESKGVTPWSVLWAQIKNLLIIILLIATLLSAFMGHTIEAVAIAVIVLFAILLGFIQEYRAERALQALRRISAPSALVIRDGRQVEIPARELVVGDIVVLKVGDKVPADLRIIESANLKIDEAALTGESVPNLKQTDPIDDPQAVIAERACIAYSGTVVSYGRGRGLVVATGLQTEFGKLTGLLQSVTRGRTPLQQNLDRVGRILAVTAMVIVMMIVALGIVRGEDLLQIFIFGVALAVAVVPEALPAVVTISLAIGVQKMVKRNALIRHLPAVETLGSTSVICSDKTGTLTKDEMTARALYLAGGQWLEVSGSGYAPQGEFLVDDQRVVLSQQVEKLLGVAALCCDAELLKVGEEWEIQGDPTEGALIVAAAKAGLDKMELEQKYPRIDEVPFTSERKRMTTLHQDEHGILACGKGAPEVIIAACSAQLGASGIAPLSEESRDQWHAAAVTMAQNALRVLAIAFKPKANKADAEENMVFLGLIGVIDPPRPEVATAIATCRNAGITPVMITGDHPETALAIASEIGLQSGHSLTGYELQHMSDDELQRKVLDTSVYARVSPEHKLRIVDAWQHYGNVVAMTGDGINDAPALKKADVGIAMGITGTDVSKEAAAVTLTDDNFSTIVGAIEEGRGIFDNIKKYLMYLLSSNIGEIGLVAAATFAGYPLPLTAVQILYVNLATDGLPALALAVDPPEPDLMQRPPRSPQTGIFTRPVVLLMLIGGIWSTFINFSLFAWALGTGRSLPEAMAMTFISLVIIQFIKAYNFRSERHSVFRKLFANKWLNLAITWEVGLLLAIIYLPFLHEPFNTYSLSASDWLVVLGMAATILPVLESVKWAIRRQLLQW